MRSRFANWSRTWKSRQAELIQRQFNRIGTQKNANLALQNISFVPGNADLVSKNAWLVGLIGTPLFAVIFVWLGFVQPGYNHARDTVSSLVLGEWGFVQSLSFMVLALVFFVVGIGVGQSIYGRSVNQVSFVFAIFALGLVALAVFPTYESRLVLITLEQLSLTARIHFLGSLGLVLFAPIMLRYIIGSMERSVWWRPLVPYTAWVLIINFIFGGLWFLLLKEQAFFAWKGLYQKLLIFNVLMWLTIVSWWLKRHN